MPDQSFTRDFERDALPHLNSAYNLARHLTRNEQDAEDIVQEAYLRALRSYHRFRGGDMRPWLLKIVRNAFYTWLKQKPACEPMDSDEDLASRDPYGANPEEVLVRSDTGVLLQRALETLPTLSREMLVLRELEEMSYKEISAIVDVPIGTVMSGLSRARARLRQSVTDLMSIKPEKATRD